MRDLIFRLQKEWFGTQLKVAFGFCVAALAGLQCLAQSSSLAPQIMSQQIKWTKGPAKADLGTFGEVQISEGFRFTDASGARAVLGLKAVPQSLLGVVQPDSGAWTAVLEFSGIGYVEPGTTKRINSTAILSAMQTKA